ISAGAVSQSQDVCFYCNYYAGYWKFDETSGTTSGDSSGNGNDGRYDGKIFNDGNILGGAGRTTGKYGYGMSFDGVDDFINITGLKNRQFSNITVSAWINAKSWNTGGIISQWGTSGVGYAAFLLGYDGGVDQLKFATYGPSGEKSTVTGYTTTDKWVFVTGQFNGTHCLIYLDGQLKGSAFCDAPQISIEYPVTIGKDPPALNGQFDGTIDEVRIYNRALSQQEIQEDMNSAYPVTKATVSYSFEKVENNKVLDTGHIVNGEYGTALGFDGFDDYVNVSDSSSLNITGNQITMEAWIKPISYADAGTIATKNMAYYFQVDGTAGINGRLAAYLYGINTGSYFYSSEIVPLNQWTHVVYTYNGSNLIFYINGTVSGNIGATGSIVPEREDSLRIGWDSSPGQRYFNGNIDEVRILNIARSMTTA
ncbi:MAG: LamG domain-containing protein, partial [Candidatus Aenigmatarchaeota archaeon]